MSLPVHLVPSLEGTAAGVRVEIEGEEAHHAVAVRRLRVGESVALTDGNGRTAVGAVAETGKRFFAVTVTEIEHQPAPAPRVSVIQALPKGERGELAVEVLTEIGAARIVPWAATRSVAVWKGERAEKSHAKWSATAREAAKQARRAWFPEVAPLATTADVVGLIAAAGTALVLHEEATSGLGSVDLTDDLLLVVGPEGGIAPDELDAFTAAGAHVVRMGTEVLRTSTAGVAAIAALLARTTRWSPPSPG